jgi:hypothetical protein
MSAAQARNPRLASTAGESPSVSLAKKDSMMPVNPERPAAK